MRRAWVSLLFVALLLAPAPVAAEWIWTQQTSSDKLIVFVHGLRGEPNASFTAQGNPSWPQLMAADKHQIRGAPSLSTYSIALVGYPAGRADRLNMQEIAYRLLVETDDNAVFDKYKDVIFVTHSLGGLIIKELLNIAAKDGYAIASKTAAVFLISVPSKGVPAAEWALKLFSDALLDDLKPIDVNSYLQNLDGDWERMLRKRQDRRPRVFCAYERLKTLGITVAPMVYTSTFCDEPPWAENKDHLAIAKPESPADSLYGWVRGRIASLHRTASSNAPHEAAPRGVTKQETSREKSSAKGPPPEDPPKKSSNPSRVDQPTSRFDGTWTITWTGSNCTTTRVESYPVHIRNGAISVAARDYSGRVLSSGTIQWSGNARKYGGHVSYTGVLTDDSGGGRFENSSGCNGTFTARKQ